MAGMLFAAGIAIHCVSCVSQRSAELVELLRQVMNMLGNPMLADEVVVADRRKDALREVRRVADEVHVGGDAHRLVAADQGPLDEVVALAVAIETRLLGPA